MSIPPSPLTLTGLSLAEAATKLDAQLPAEAYSPVPGGADLTDIDPNWMRVVLNEVFGLCGYGWGYSYHPANLEYHNEIREGKRGDRNVIVAIVKHLEFWYRLNLGDTVEVFKIPATGNSENSTHAYALKGALTNAIGNAVSNIGFQQAVYLGQRDHKTVRTGKRPAPQQAQPAPQAQAPARPRPTQEPPADPPADLPPTPPPAPVPPPVLPPAPAHNEPVANGHPANGKTNGHNGTNGTHDTANGNGRPAPRPGKPGPQMQTAPAPEPPAASSKPAPRRVAAPAPAPEPPTLADDGGACVIGFGRFRGRQVNSLTPNSLVWLANPDGKGLLPSSSESEHAQAAARKYLAAHPVPA